MRIQFESSYEIEINKSRFICYLHRVESEQEAREYIASIKRLHPKASHHCSAILIDQNCQRSSDDNEPSGTAGIPMLEALKKREMEKIVAVTVRYFGGIKLGAGGLIRAYSQSVTETLDHTQLYETKELLLYQLIVDYSTASKLEKVLSQIHLISRDYRENVTLTFAVEKEEDLAKINEILLGKYGPVFVKKTELEVEV